MMNIPHPSVQSPSLPLVTVVTVTYNLVKAGRTAPFRQCIASVQNQDYPHIEHLIMDGGSADGTLDLIREYEQQGAVRCYSEPDKGIYDAMNKGLARATGKYIAFLNSDDYWHDPCGIRQSVELLEATRADFSCAPCQTVKEDGSFFGYCDAFIPFFVVDVPWCHQTMLTKTELLRQIGGFNDSRKIAADYECELQLLLMGAKPVYVPHCFTTFRVGGISNKSPLLDEEIKAIHQRFYGNVAGNEIAATIRRGKIPVRLYQFLLDCVHPSVARDMGQYFISMGAWVYMAEARQYHVKNLMEGRGKPCMGTTGRIGGIFPYALRYGEGEKRIIFCGCPLYVEKLQSKGAASFIRWIFLFGFLPLFKEKVAGRRKKGYLLGFIPLYTALIE